MEVSFYGVRALVPVPGPTTVRHGGNTACTLVRLSDGGLLILDCGTGARGLGLHLLDRDFARGQKAATFLLSHPRWDRVQGFPFFRPFYAPSNRFTIYAGLATTLALEAVLEGQMAAHYFPLHTFRNMGAALDLRALAPQAATNPHSDVAPAAATPITGESLVEHAFRVGSAHVRALVRVEGDSAWAAYRIEDGGRVLVYAAAPVLATSAARALCSKADLLIHHAGAIDDLVDLSRAAEVRTLALFDYDPDTTDADVDRLLVHAHRRIETAPASHAGRESPLTVRAAAEGLTLQV